MNPSWKKNYVRYRSIFLSFVGNYKERGDVKVYLELFLSLATIILFAVFALRPTLLTISRLIREIEAKQETIEEMDAKIADLISAQRLYDQNRQNINLLMQAVPPTADPEVVLRQLEGGISETQIGVKNLEMKEMLVSNNSSGSNENQSIKEEIVITISTTSDYTNLYNFINILEELRKPLKINKASFDYSVTQSANELVMTVESILPIVRQQ